MPTEYDFTPRPTVALQNPLDIYSRAAQTANALNEVKLFRAREAAGQAYQQATDPATGRVDPARAQALIAGNPQAALAAQGSATSGQALQDAQLGFNTAQQQRIAGTVGSALSLPDAQQNAQTYKALLDQELAAKTIDAGHYQNAIANMPQSNDPAAWRGYGTRMLVGALAGPQMAQTLLPSNQDVNTGSAIQPIVRAPALSGGGMTQAPGAVPTTLSPADLAQQVSGPTGPDGKPTFETLGQRLARQGAQIPGAPGTASPLGTGRLPAALAPSQAQPPGGTAVPAGQSAAQTAAQTETGGASAKAFQDITDAGTQAQARGAVLDNMLADTTQFTTGPGAATIEKIRAVANRMGMPVDTEKLSASESFNKLAANLASQQGAGSDARLSVAQSGNPHADLSPAGVDLMLRQLRGNEDYLQARAKLGASYPDTADRRGFEAKIGSKLDPRTFQYNRMTPAQKMTYFKSLGTDKAKNDFINAHNAASGLLSSQ